MTTATADCRALLVAAPSSGQGKTTVTAALARWYRDQGLRVRVFKTGPDFLDPMVLERASGSSVLQLDLWMGGSDHCADLLHRAALDADIILVEGVMGLHDGTPSSADLAIEFDLPVLLVIDASAMAQTFGAVAQGLRTYRPSLQVAGALANRVGGSGHARMLRDSLPPDLAWYGALPRDERWALPSRYLGLVQAAEVKDIEERVAAAARCLESLARSEDSARPLPPVVRFAAASVAGVAPVLAGVRIAVARDAAFSFLYAANVEALRSLGAELLFFSPLADEPVPQSAHSLYLPGGYPELHLASLARNAVTRESIRAHHVAGRPLVAECGGMLALLDTLTDVNGLSAPMFGLLPGSGVLAGRLVNLGLHGMSLPEGELRGHTFHHARIETSMPAAAHTTAQRHQGAPEAVFRRGRLFASFMHLYFPSNPAAVAALFKP